MMNKLYCCTYVYLFFSVKFLQTSLRMSMLLIISTRVAIQTICTTVVKVGIDSYISKNKKRVLLITYDYPMTFFVDTPCGYVQISDKERIQKERQQIAR